MINGGLTVNGNVQLATNPTVYSDRRLKANVTRIEDALSMVQALHGVKYSWLQLDHLHEDREEDAASIGRTLAEMRELKSNLEGVTFDTARHVGLMAQDVQSVLPEAVHPIHDGAYLGVNYADLVPLLVEAIHGSGTRRSIPPAAVANPALLSVTQRLSTSRIPARI